MVFNATFNNISVISWRSVSLVEENAVPGENHWPVASHWQSFILEATDVIEPKLYRNCHWMFSYKMLISMSIWNKYGSHHMKMQYRKYYRDWTQIVLEWSLDGPLLSWNFYMEKNSTQQDLIIFLKN